LRKRKLHTVIAWSFAYGKTPKLSGVAGEQAYENSTSHRGQWSNVTSLLISG
jgi:hypothetical protein